MTTFPQISLLSQTQSAQQAGVEKTTGSSKTPASDFSFQQILSTLAMSSSLSGSADAESGGMDFLSPILIGLVEKLIEMQISRETQSTSKTNVAQQSGFGSEKPYGRPVGGVLTQNFHPGHNGLDFGVEQGTPVKATMDGKVVYAGWNNEGYGNLVIVENGPYRTFYAHLSEVPVTVGQEVKGGTVVGLSGTTGNSTGPHLHYEVRENGQVIDPTSFTLNLPTS
jgi:murein DD-endopeptidase MepM/ murein hydrolase activator NlpD